MICMGQEVADGQRIVNKRLAGGHAFFNTVKGNGIIRQHQHRRPLVLFSQLLDDFRPGPLEIHMDDIHLLPDFRVVSKKAFYHTAVRAVKGALIRCVIPGVEHIQDWFFHNYLMKLVRVLATVSGGGTSFSANLITFMIHAMFLPKISMICLPSASCSISPGVWPWATFQ